MIDIKGNILFNIQLLHKYYSNGLCPDFTIVPSPSTAALLANCQLLWKQYGSQGLVAARFNGKTGTMIIPPASQPFTFFLQCNNTLFWNFTDLPLPGLDQQLLYFTNRNNNISGSQKLLSVAVPGGNVSAADLLTFLPPVSQYPSTPLSAAVSAITYQVNGFNPVADDYSTIVVAPVTLNFTAPVTQFPLDLSALPAGKYVLLVSGQPAVNIYLNGDLRGTADYRGVIEIYTDMNVPAGYPVFGAGNTLLSPQYSLSFLNRATIWQYVLVSQKTTTLTDVAGVYTFTCNVPATPPVIVTLTSNTPIPLSQNAQNFSLSQAGAFTLKHIPCADAQQLQQITIGMTQYYCSTIYVNY